MKRTGHLHNSALQILVELGVAGLPAAAMGERAPVAGSSAAITGFLLTGTAEYNFGDSEVVMLAWVIVALPYVVARGGPVAFVKGVP